MRVLSCGVSHCPSYSRVAVAEDGSVLATWIQNSGGKTPRVFASSSSDGGNTWSTPANVFDIAQPAEAACNNIRTLTGRCLIPA